MNTLFIVVTASFNRPELLRRNIAAMLAQTYGNWQQIIVDDASTADMGEAFALAASDPRITVIRSPENRGCNATRNHALDVIREQSLAGFVTLVDDDDYLLPEALGQVAQHMQQVPGYSWYTADCCYPDGTKASRLARHGRLSYLQDYMFGKVIKGDLNHFMASEAIANIRFTEEFRNGQEWSFYCQLAGKTDFFAFDSNIKVIEYLPDGLSRLKINSRERLKVNRLKVRVLAPLVSPQQLSRQQLLLARELLGAGEAREALATLKSIARYQCLSLRFYRYLFKALLARR